MRFAIVFAATVFATSALAQDTVSDAASQLEENDCMLLARISDQIAEYRQDGKSERRATKLLTSGRNAVEERMRPAVPTLVGYFYSLPKETVQPGAASEAFLASCDASAAQ